MAKLAGHMAQRGWPVYGGGVHRVMVDRSRGAEDRGPWWTAPAGGLAAAVGGARRRHGRPRKTHGGGAAGHGKTRRRHGWGRHDGASPEPGLPPRYRQRGDGWRRTELGESTAALRLRVRVLARVLGGSGCVGARAGEMWCFL